MKALELLENYMNTDFGCDMSEHVKECEEAIAELEALSNRSCHNCKHLDKDMDDYPCDSCKETYAHMWEAK